MVQWPYLVGFDTVEYVAAVRDALCYNWNPIGRTWWYGGWSNRPLLLYSALYVPARLGINIVLIMKIIPPILYGILGLSTAFYMVKRGFRPIDALACSIMVSSYFMVLGLSWQLMSNLLGVALVLISLANFSLPVGRCDVEEKRFLFLLVSSLLAYLARPTAVVMLLAVYTLTLLTGVVRSWRRAIVLVTFILLGVLILL
ncbi:MAG: hypothetical protein DRK00_08785 [Thermoprotei archaeon]|nr:MAG: hypothetical protein DRK00_08785 [Thermoprotei archaeon]